MTFKLVVSALDLVIDAIDRGIALYDSFFFPKPGDLIASNDDLSYFIDDRIVRRRYENEDPILSAGTVCIFMGRHPSPGLERIRRCVNLSLDGSIVIKHGSIDVFVPDRLMHKFDVIAKGGAL